MEYIGPVYSHKIKDWKETKKALKWLKKQGYISSASEGPSGIGETAGMALSLVGNKMPGPYSKIYNLKTKREGKSSKITGFSKTPIWTEGWYPKRILEELGYPSEKSERSLMVGVTHKPNNQGIFLRCDGERISIHTNDSMLGFFTEEMLKAGFSKSSLIIFLFARSQCNQQGKEQFHYHRAELVKLKKKITMDSIFRFVEKGIFSMEFRMYLRDDGTVRDHGFGFRFNSTESNIFVKERIFG